MKMLFNPLFIMITVFTLLSFQYQTNPSLTTDTFKVHGNIACKAQIEELIVTIHGVESAEWNVETLLMQVTYDNTIVTRHQFFTKLAEAGYDNQGLRAKDSFYDALDEACKYERPSVND